MKLLIELGQNSEYSIEVTLNQNTFTQKWVKVLSADLQLKSFDQAPMFASFLPFEQQKENLINCIKVINQFLGKEYIQIPKTIQSYDDEVFNSLHESFERLVGSTDSTTRLFYIAPSHIKQAIRNLNVYCHSLEKPKYSQYYFPIHFNKDNLSRIKLDPDDYAYFNNRCEGGKAYLSYIEVGKTYRDLFLDNLPVTYEGAHNMHYYCSDFNLNLDPRSYGNHVEKQFQQWCVQNNVDYNNKQLGIGFIELGTINANVTEIFTKVSELKFLNKITLI